MVNPISNELSLNLTNKKIAIFKTDAATKSATPIIIKNSATSELEQFANSTMLESTKQTKVREYYYPEDSQKEVASCIEDIVNNISSEDINSIFNTNMNKIAKRYIEKEHTIVTNASAANKPSPCSLFTYMEINDSELIFFIAKIDIEEYFDEESLTIKNGLPHNKDGKKTKNWKTAKFLFDITHESFAEEIVTTYSFSKATLTDSSSKIAEYWADSFLELTELTDDESNTKNICILFEKTIKSFGGANKSEEVKLANKMYLESFYSYMHTHEIFEFNDAIASIFGTHDNGDSKNPTSILVDRIQKNYKFDTSFGIVNDILKKKGTKTFKISHDITLNVTFTNQLREKIKSGKDTHGNLILAISITDENDPVYKEFLDQSTE